MDLTVNQSSPATFSCTAQGNPVPTISWTGPSDNFTTNYTFEANFTVLSVLTIDSAVRALHEGLYTCSASNGVGPSPSSNATLTVQGTGETPPPHNTRCTVDLPHLASCTTLYLLSHPTIRPQLPTVELLYCTICSFLFSSSSLSSPHSASCPEKDCGYRDDECHFGLYHLGCLPRGPNREHPVDL